MPARTVTSRWTSPGDVADDQEPLEELPLGQTAAGDDRDRGDLELEQELDAGRPADDAGVGQVDQDESLVGEDLLEEDGLVDDVVTALSP